MTFNFDAVMQRAYLVAAQIDECRASFQPRRVNVGERFVLARYIRQSLLGFNPEVELIENTAKLS